MAQLFEREGLLKLHHKIAAAFSSRVAIKAKIASVPNLADWESAVAGTAVYFEMFPAEGTVAVERFSGSLRGAKTIFSFETGGNKVPLWVSWSEEWVKRASDKKTFKGRPTLELIGFSLTFYAGLQWREKTPLIRADWDDPLHRGSESAQPHWHIDPSILDLPSWEAISAPLTVDEKLQELPVPPREQPETVEAGFFSLEKLHLGMAGWRHAASIPRCWQQKMEPPHLADVPVWLDKVLGYFASELTKVTAFV